MGETALIFLENFHFQSDKTFSANSKYALIIFSSSSEVTENDTPSLENGAIDGVWNWKRRRQFGIGEGAAVGAAEPILSVEVALISISVCALASGIPLRSSLFRASQNS